MSFNRNIAYLDVSSKNMRRIQEAMVQVANGREVRVEADSYKSSASLAIRKANGWWATTMIPAEVDNISSKDPEEQMLAYMNLLPRKQSINSIADAIVFAIAWTKEHRND